ncbi:MAG: DinB family protein, partial [Firmicutes bacterium]|nr:DinB family protein [Bacillota bacterium]
EHLADAEAFYRVRLEAPGPGLRRHWKEAAAPGAPWRERLERSRQALVQRLRSLTPAERARLAVHEPHAEAWTARKVLYRAAWHERHHTRQIERWLTE